MIGQTVAEFRQQQADAMTEAQLQAAIIGTGPKRPGLAQGLGWGLAYHTHRSDRSPAGFPDLVLVNVRAGRLVFAELKRQRKSAKPSPAQVAWLEGLEQVRYSAGDYEQHPPFEPVRVYLWRPLDLLDGTIERILRASQ